MMFSSQPKQVFFMHKSIQTISTVLWGERSLFSLNKLQSSNVERKNTLGLNLSAVLQKQKKQQHRAAIVSLAMIASRTSFLQWTDTTQRKCPSFIYVRSLFCQERGPRPVFQAFIGSFISSLSLIHIVQAQFSKTLLLDCGFDFLERAHWK